MQRLFIFAVVGLVAQLIDGALGMAYGVTATTLLLSTGSAPAVASASVHLAEVGTTLVSGLSHWRFGNVSWRTVGWIGVPGAAGGFFGAVVLSSFSAQSVKPLVAVILLCLGAFIVWRFAFGGSLRSVPEQHMRPRFLGPLGLSAGFLDAIGGGGWGPITTPTLMTAGRMQPRRAIGSASASEFLVAVSASAGFLWSLGRSGVDLRLVTALLAGGVCAAPLAAWLVHRLHPRVMGTLVGGVILLTNSRTVLLASGLGGPTRLACLLVLAVVCATVVLRTALTLPREPREPRDVFGEGGDPLGSVDGREASPALPG